MTREEYELLLKKLETQMREEYQQRRKSIDYVYRLSQGLPLSVPPAPAPTLSQPAMPVPQPTGTLLNQQKDDEPDELEDTLTLARAVRQYVSHTDEEFSTNDVRDALESRGVTVLDASLRSLLNRMYQKTKEIVVVRQGVGRRPSIYKKA